MAPEPTVERAAVEGALDDALDAVVRTVRRAARAPGAARRAVPGSTWSVAETVNHLCTLHRRAISDFRRSSTPEETAELNATCLEEDAERDLDVLADRLEGDGALAHDNLRQLPIDLPFPFHAGTTTTVVPASGVVLAEYLVHGWEIRRALGEELPEVDPDHAQIALRAFAPLLDGWHRPGPEIEVAFHLIGSGDVAIVRSTLEQLSLQFPSDHRGPAIDVSAGALLLAFPFGRLPMPTGTEALLDRIAPI